MSRAFDPTIITACLAGLENAINKALSLTPKQGEELLPFSDNVFALHCTAPSINVFAHTQHNKIRLSSVYEGPVTTRLRGDFSDFTELARASDPAATLINGGLELEGDSAPLIELQKVIASLEVDWEAPLVSTLGDVAGHQLAQLLRHTFTWGKSATNSLHRQIEEFIHEEARLSPPKLEIEDFYDDIRALGQQVERLESRTQRLRQRIAKHLG